MSTVQTLGMCLAMGTALFGITVLFGWLSITYNLNSNLFKWLLLPTLGYCIAVCLNIVIQYTSCGFVKFDKIAYNSLYVLYFILFFLGITLFGFVRAPIIAAVPTTLRVGYGGIFAIGFYMFWAGMFGEAFSGGFAQGCGSDP